MPVNEDSLDNYLDMIQITSNNCDYMAIVSVAGVGGDEEVLLVVRQHQRHQRSVLFW